MENKNERNLPVEATEKAITTGEFGKEELTRTGDKMNRHVKEVEKIKEETKSIDNAKNAVAKEVEEKENNKDENVKE